MNCVVPRSLCPLIAIALVVGGCAPASRDSGGAALSVLEPPPDFAIDATVLSGDPEASMKPAHLRTSRYVLRPDGSLYSEFGPDLTADTFPAYTRTLRRDEVAALWGVIQNLGVLRAGSDPLANPAMVRSEPGQFTAVIAIRAGGRTSIIGRTRQLAEAPDPAVRALVRSLASLAWASDLPDPSLTRAPIRYNFGPDPYARYRQQDQPTDAPQR